MRNRTSNLRIPRSDALPLSHRDPMVSDYEVHLSHACDKTEKTSFPISSPSSKFTISLISIYKHYAIDIADPSSMPPPPALICKLFFIFTHKAKIKCPRNKYGVIVSLNSILWVRSRVRPQITLSRAENKAVSYCF